MNILKQTPYYRSVIDVEHNGFTYRRSVTGEDVIKWVCVSHEGECDEGKLEELFVTMLEDMRNSASNTLATIRRLISGSNKAFT